MADPEYLMYFSIRNLHHIEEPRDFIERFLSCLCNTEDLGTVEEHRGLERVVGRWGTDRVGYAYESTWSDETTEIPERVILRTYGLDGLELEWRFESCVYGISGHAEIKHCSLCVRFRNDAARASFANLWEKLSGKPPDLTEQSAPADADRPCR